MCVVNKQFKLIEFVLIPFMYDNSLTFITGSVCLCSVCSHVVVFDLSVSCLGALCGCGGCCDCDVCTVVCIPCTYAERVQGFDGDGNVGMGAGCAGCEYMGGTRGSGLCLMPTTC